MPVCPMCSRAVWTVLPCGSRTAFFGVMMIFAFMLAPGDFAGSRRGGRDYFGVGKLLKFAGLSAKVAGMKILNSPAQTNGGNGDRKNLDACSIVIFGASGDLTARKLIPAIYHLFKEKQMPATFRVIGFARREKTDASWRQELR